MFLLFRKSTLIFPFGSNDNNIDGENESEITSSSNTEDNMFSDENIGAVSSDSTNSNTSSSSYKKPMRKRRNKNSVHKQRKKNKHPQHKQSRASAKQQGSVATKKVTSDTSTDEEYQIRQEMEIAKSCMSTVASEHRLKDIKSQKIQLLGDLSEKVPRTPEDLTDETEAKPIGSLHKKELDSRYILLGKADEVSQTCQ